MKKNYTYFVLSICCIIFIIGCVAGTHDMTLPTITNTVLPTLSETNTPIPEHTPVHVVSPTIKQIHTPTPILQTPIATASTHMPTMTPTSYLPTPTLPSTPIMTPTPSLSTSTPPATPTIIPTPSQTPHAPITPTPPPTPTITPTPSLPSISTPVPTPDTEITPEQMLDTLTIEQKVGQLFIVRCPQSIAASVAYKYQFGGYILFGRDFKNLKKEQVISNIESYQNTSKIPMLIAVDEEGGTVNRVSYYTEFRSSPFLSPRDLFELGGFELIVNDTEEKCNLLKSLGINLNLAPVCDVSINPSDFMYKRSFGISAEMTSEYIKNVVSVMVNNNMGCALKHFPGYGNNVDTHTGIAIDERTIESFWECDLKPFQAGINEGADIVLVSHNIINAIDPEHPASLSYNIHKLLRDEIGFNGLIMTDDLYMDAIRKYTNGEEAAVMAVISGNDLICCTDYETQYNAVLNAVKSGQISLDRLNESVLRILRYKYAHGLIK